MKNKLTLISIILCLAISVAACGGNPAPSAPSGNAESGSIAQTSETESSQNIAESPIDIAEYNRLHNPVIYTMIGNGWDSPEQIEPDAFVNYYQYLVAGKVITTPDSYIIPDSRELSAEALEEVILSRFDVSVEHIRKSRFYLPDNNTYELMGIGGAWGGRIVEAEQTGDQLVMKFETFTARDLPMGDGVLIAEVSGDSCIYRSLTYEDRPSFILAFPATTGNIFEDGQFIMETTGLTIIGNPDSVDSKRYDGRDLNSIIAFYDETLKELGATGAADTEKHENGWAWAGTYDGGKTIQVDVTPVEDEAVYVITMEIDE